MQHRSETNNNSNQTRNENNWKEQQNQNTYEYKLIADMTTLICIWLNLPPTQLREMFILNHTAHKQLLNRAGEFRASSQMHNNENSIIAGGEETENQMLIKIHTFGVNVKITTKLSCAN